MPKYIKADELSRAKFHPLPYTHITPADIKDKEAYERGWNDSIDAIIESAPTADVAEIVRCKECIHHSNATKTMYVWCDCIDGLLPKDWFCADGERRDDGQTHLRKPT